MTTTPPATAILQCTGEPTATASVENEANVNGTYSATISGTVINERSDTISQIEVWFGYNGGLADNIGAGTAFTQADPMGPGAQSSWSFYETDLTSPITNLYIENITYNDDSEGAYCDPYPIGGSTRNG